MMRCKACNALMSEDDIRRKDKETGEYLDLCAECYLESQRALHDAYEDYIEILLDMDC
jgi:hypothetical protein